MFGLIVNLPILTSQALTLRKFLNTSGPKKETMIPPTHLGEAQQMSSFHQVLFHDVRSLEPIL